MAFLRASQTGWLDSRRVPADDSYTAWFNANSRCAEALRAWQEAAPAARSDAYRGYVAALGREEAAAAELELLHTEPLAA
jgi:hypothetical protein